MAERTPGASWRPRWAGLRRWAVEDLERGPEPIAAAADLARVGNSGRLFTRGGFLHTNLDMPPCPGQHHRQVIQSEQVELSPHEIGDKQFFYGKGCEVCNHTGYKGRKGIYELLDITEPIRELITQRAPSVVIRQKAIEMGMSTLRSDGLRSIFEGETTIEEVLKYT